jgi:hypothetical protein
VATSTNTGLSTSLKTSFAFILQVAGPSSQNRHTRRDVERREYEDGPADRLTLYRRVISTLP